MSLLPVAAILFLLPRHVDATCPCNISSCYRRHISNLLLPQQGGGGLSNIEAMLSFTQQNKIAI